MWTIQFSAASNIFLNTKNLCILEAKNLSEYLTCLFLRSFSSRNANSWKMLKDLLINILVIYFILDNCNYRDDQFHILYLFLIFIYIWVQCCNESIEIQVIPERPSTCTMRATNRAFIIPKEKQKQWGKFRVIKTQTKLSDRESEVYK